MAASLLFYNKEETETHEDEPFTQSYKLYERKVHKQEHGAGRRVNFVYFWRRTD